MPTRAPETVNPRCSSADSTACPCGSRIPDFGRTRTVAFIRVTTDGFSRYAGNGIVVSRSNASMYFERVSATTSAGSSGPGAVLFQLVISQ